MPSDISSESQRVRFFDERERRPRRFLIALRFLGILAALVVVGGLWRLTASLSWQVDFLLAVVATLAWSYYFEREDT